jgi:hypothetical protein
MASVTAEQAHAGMELWQAWAGRAGGALVDLGAPLGDAAIVGNGETFTLRRASHPGGRRFESG